MEGRRRKKMEKKKKMAGSGGDGWRNYPASGGCGGRERESFAPGREREAGRERGRAEILRKA